MVTEDDTMFGKILNISENSALVKIADQSMINNDLINLHLVFEDPDKRILGEIESIEGDIIRVNFLGEFAGNNFVGGIMKKPTMTCNIRTINREEIPLIMGQNNGHSFLLGESPLYDKSPIFVDINDFFSNHLAIFGNTGSGKSCGVARVIQNLYNNPNFLAYKSNIFIFDAYGEYHNAFKEINKISPHLNFKFYTTNVVEVTEDNKLSIPLWLLDVDDIALLLNAETHNQLTIIERTLKLVNIFAQSDEQSQRYKNHIIAKAMMAILFSNKTPASKKNDIFGLMNDCSTKEFNLEAVVQGIGYTRKFRECFNIDNHGNFTESVLITKYITSFIDEELDNFEARTKNFYNLEDLEKALHFTLISEGLLNNDKAYNEAVTLKVRLHSIVIGEYAQFFRYPEHINLETYISRLITTRDNRKAQIINLNIEDVDDWFGKVVAKVYAKMFFEFTKNLKNRATIPIHMFLEESHRYVQNDNDTFLLGYNIFDRIAKEGRKYGLILSLISQRPVELSETAISQCSNFLIFKMNHPRDIEYIKKMVPAISAEIIEKQKSLQPGTCMAFGKAFKIPLIVKMQMPDPEPSSSSCNVFNTWMIQNPNQNNQ